MSDLVEFLLARIGEDEAEAKFCIDAGISEPGYHLLQQIYTSFPEDGHAADLADRFSPARVLAECAAKRAIVDALSDYDDGHVWASAEGSRAEDALLALAQPYASHPDYRQEWAPQ